MKMMKRKTIKMMKIMKMMYVKMVMMREELRHRNGRRMKQK